MKHAPFYIFLGLAFVSLSAMIVWVVTQVPPAPAIIATAADVTQTVTIFDPANESSLGKKVTEDDFIDDEPTEELETFTFTFNITAQPEHRQSSDIPAEVYFRKDGNLIALTDDIRLDNTGYAQYEAELTEGSYDIGLNGISHLTKTTYSLYLSQAQPVYDLDYTAANTFELTAGDAYDDNIVISSDIAQMLNSYRALSPSSNPLPSDMTGDGIINSIDIAILLQNYRMAGDQ